MTHGIGFLGRRVATKAPTVAIDRTNKKKEKMVAISLMRLASLLLLDARSGEADINRIAVQIPHARSRT
jgi:hypothetical protein